MHGHLEILKLLLLRTHLEHEMSIELRAAARGGHTEILELLLMHGADEAALTGGVRPSELDKAPSLGRSKGVDGKSSDGLPALHAAAKSGNIPLVKLLLKPRSIPLSRIKQH